MSNFIILIGGPGAYETCDTEHDAAWLNYVVPIQVGMQNRKILPRPGERIHWFVYEPAYVERWNDDVNSKIDFIEKQVKAIAAKGASSYMDRISTIANGLGVNLVKLHRKQDFWSKLSTFPNGSITRVWYSGHASSEGLMLKIKHSLPNSAGKCDAEASVSDMILVTELRPELSPKFASNPMPSVFLGCNTSKLAEYWNNNYGIPTQGANGKINFGLINLGPKSTSIIDRLKQSATIRWEAYN